MKFSLYFHPETYLTAKPKNEIELLGAMPDYEYVRETIYNKYGSDLTLNKVDFGEYTSVHTDEYVDSILNASRDQDYELTISMECDQLYYFIPGYEYALGGTYSALDHMRKGWLDRAYIYSLGSHHAYPNKGHGYCLVNTLAAAVRYAQSIGFGKVLILDWDIHHGDGTQSIFEYDQSVYQISVHSALDLYMSKMRVAKFGSETYGEEVGHCNIPVLSLAYDEKRFRECEMEGAFYRHDTCITRFREALFNLPFDPDIIFIFDGHDGHIDDCGTNITNWDYAEFAGLTKAALSVAKSHSCPVLSMPGGGYNNRSHIRCCIQHIELFSEG